MVIIYLVTTRFSDLSPRRFNCSLQTAHVVISTTCQHTFLCPETYKKAGEDPAT